MMMMTTMIIIMIMILFHRTRTILAITRDADFSDLSDSTPFVDTTPRAEFIVVP